MYWTLCARNVDKARREFTEVLDSTGLFETYGWKPRFSTDFFDNLDRIFVENWVDITEVHSKLEERLASIVEGQILRILGEGMRY